LKVRSLHYILFAIVLLLAWSPAALVAAALGSTQVFEGADLFRLECASDPQIRSDGRAVAYVRRTYDVMTDRERVAVWLIDTETGRQSQPGAVWDSSNLPRWSPDGTQLAYLAQSADGRTHLIVYRMQTASESRIADLNEAPHDFVWSPDGRSLAFELFTPAERTTLGEAPHKPEGAKWADALQIVTAIDYRHDGDGYARPGEYHLYVVSSDGGSPRQLTFGPYREDALVAWTQDGRYLLISGERTNRWELEPEHSEVYQVAVSDGAIKQLTHRFGPNQEPTVSPDGSTIAYLGFDDHLRSYENTRVYLMDRDGNHARVLTSGLDRSVDAAHWAADGKSLYFSYIDRGVGKVAQVFLDGHIHPVAFGLSGASVDRPYSGGMFTVADNGTVAYTSGTAERPADISVVRDGRVRQLTHLNDDLFQGRMLAEERPLSVTSSFDHQMLDAWLALPPAAEKGRRYPLILEIHGGPFSSYGPVFSSDVQLYAASGYAVVYSNPRGSTSYGEEFANLIHHDFPSHDYDDLMSVVDAAIATGSVDPDELFVTGGSAGGVLTAWIVGKTHRFRAAATQKPVVNWLSQTLATDVATYDTEYWFATRPWEDANAYWEHSPLSLVGSVTTPMLIVVGTQDYRTTENEADQYYKALQLLRVPTVLIRVPGASHGGLASRPSQSAAKASAIISWFNRYRADATPP
jgi:dipeptidyl aminopeptidase/acylaminoacyl peptidase